MTRPTLLALAVLTISCTKDPATYPHIPETASACEGACIVLDYYGCPEALRDVKDGCAARCEAMANVGYIWTNDKSGPVCIKGAKSVSDVRACNVKCEGR